MDSSLLRDAITAWSSTHLALQNNNYENTAREHRGIALSSLSKSLASQQRDPQMELASSLIHCAMESVTGDTNQWFKHLVGASEIIRSAAAVDHETHQTDLSKFTSTVEGRWLLSNFAYHDVMMTISEDRKPLLLAGDYWNFSVSQSGVADSYFGFASKVMSLISQISVLNVDMLNDDTTDTGKQGEQDDFATTAKSLQQELIDWKCPQSNNTMLVNLAESYRSAGLIHLYRILRRHRPKLTNATTLKIAEQVTVIVHRVQDIAIGSLAESSLLLPLFLAGGDAKDVQHIQIIRSRMQEIIKTRHFRNFQPALEVLEETWHMGGLGIRTGDGKPVDWKDVTKRKGWMLSIT
ncbi:putative c6 transcription factor [Phaeomoniella chlamydospora]|uniref:Putative c6 transcription factor n=1 Tax=Phaeomoniella chlamydospora TaxID=158046 RepID=A0A0G2EVK4_PHACM|nr:putative c6 transcription factor [Phaeomoniella chlamydospora]